MRGSGAGSLASSSTPSLETIFEGLSSAASFKFFSVGGAFFFTRPFCKNGFCITRIKGKHYMHDYKDTFHKYDQHDYSNKLQCRKRWQILGNTSTLLMSMRSVFCSLKIQCLKHTMFSKGQILPCRIIY